MLLEGTKIYFWLLFLIFLAVYITVKLCLGSLLKKMRDKEWKGYIPFYTTFVLVKKLSLKPFVFYMTLIPFINLYYYNIIIKKLLEVFGQNTNNSIWYIIFPMYKFPELVFKDPMYMQQSNYELTKEFVDDQKILFKKQEDMPNEANNNNVNNNLVINPSSFNQNMETIEEVDNTPKDPNEIASYINSQADNIYTNTITDDERNKVTYVEAKQEEKKEEKPIITPLNQGEEKVCPKCHTRLAPNATTCFMCGTVLE